MDEFKQYRTLLDSVDMEESIKTQLVSAFTNVETSANSLVSDLRGRIEKESKKPEELKEKLSNLKKTLGVADDATYEDLQNHIEKLRNKNGDTVPKEQYELDLQKVRQLAEEHENGLNEYKNKFEDLQFETQIVNNGYLEEYAIEHPAIREALVKDLKSRAVFENGNAFVSDGNGGILKDVTSSDMRPIDLKSHLQTLNKTNPLYEMSLKNPMANKNGANVKGDAPAQAQTEENAYSEIFN